MNADFSPTLGAYASLKPFVFWAQTTLPTVFDDSLSYYEVLTKLTKMVNTLLENVDTAEENVELLAKAYDKLQKYVNDYFTNLDVQNEINNKLDEMAEDGSLTALLAPFIPDLVTDWLQENIDTIDFQDEVDDKVDRMVESGEFDDIVDPLIKTKIPDAVSDWLEENITAPTGSPAVDASLSIECAAGDAKATGQAIAKTQRGLANIPANSDLYALRGTYYKHPTVSTGILNEPIELNSTLYEFISMSPFGTKGGDPSPNTLQIFATENKIYARILSIGSTGGGEEPTVTTYSDSGLFELAVSSDIDELAESKQNKLTFDNTPTPGSSNPVTSEGIYAEFKNQKIERDIATGGNIISNQMERKNNAWNGVAYTWNEDTCHITGRPSATSFNTVLDTHLSFPKGIEKGKTYKITHSSNKVTTRIYKYVNDEIVLASIFSSNKPGYFTVPDDADGLSFRLYALVASGDIDEYVTFGVTEVEQPERLVFKHKIAFFGDSITAGRNGNEAATSRTPYTITDTIEKRLGVICDNYGVGSMGYVARGNGYNGYEKIAETNLNPYDTIIICLGVNDGFNPIGTYDDTDETTVMGQFNKIVNYIYSQKNAAQLIVVAPWNGCNVGSFPKYWYGSVPSKAYSRGVLSDTLKQACEYYNIPYIEQKDSPFNGFTIRKDILDSDNKSLTYMGADGVHPTDKGYKAIGGWLSGKLSTLLG